jgi:hypothetical protein
MRPCKVDSRSLRPLQGPEPAQLLERFLEALRIKLLDAIRRSARAVPPVASPTGGTGGVSASTAAAAWCRASSSSRRTGGSERRQRSVKRSEPSSTERSQAGPALEPIASWVDPPPTSQTPTGSTATGGHAHSLMPVLHTLRPSKAPRP